MEIWKLVHWVETLAIGVTWHQYPESRLMKFSIPNLRIPSHTGIFKGPQSISCYMDKRQPSVPSRTGCSYHKHSSLTAARGTSNWKVHVHVGENSSRYCNIIRMIVSVTGCTYSTVKENLSHQHKSRSKKTPTCMCSKIKTLHHGCAHHINNSASSASGCLPSCITPLVIISLPLIVLRKSTVYCVQ